MDAQIYEGDCNEILIKQIFPTHRHESYRRALRLLDPYGLNLKWEVISQAGQLETIDMFLNFPVMGMKRNALWRDPGRVRPEGFVGLTPAGGTNPRKRSRIRPLQSVWDA